MGVALSAGLADFIKNADTKDAGPDAGELAKRVIADTIAVILSGAGSDVAPPMLEHVSRMGRGDVPLIGTHASASAPAAALVGGTFGAALDFDDVLSMMPGHPAAVVMPALIAQCYDIRCPAPTSSTPTSSASRSAPSSRRGSASDTTSVDTTPPAPSLSSVPSAPSHAASTFSEDQTRMAMSLAASTASGIQANFGTMTKPFHSGWAAQSAVIAVDLVRSGFTASLSALEDKGGYLSAYGTEESDASKVLPLLGKPWTIVSPGIALKKFPTCYATHRAIDGVAEIEREVGPLRPQLAKLTCRVVPGALLPLRFHRPKTGLEGKFSMPYGLAVAMLDRQPHDRLVRRSGGDAPRDLGALREDRGRRGRGLRSGGSRLNKKSAGTRGFVLVEAKLEDGRKVSRRVDTAPGHPKRPLTWGELNGKFLDCAQAARSTAALRRRFSTPCGVSKTSPTSRRCCAASCHQETARQAAGRGIEAIRAAPGERPKEENHGERFYKTADGQAGIFFTLFGALVAWQASISDRNRAKMGPGYFPLGLGILLTVVGIGDDQLHPNIPGSGRRSHGGAPSPSRPRSFSRACCC